MSVVDIESVKVDDLVPGDHISVAVFGENCVSVKCGVYTGFCSGGEVKVPELNEARLFENGLWMWDGYRWIDVTRCTIARKCHTDYLPDNEMPFCDFSNIFGEEYG